MTRVTHIKKAILLILSLFLFIDGYSQGTENALSTMFQDYIIATLILLADIIIYILFLYKRRYWQRVLTVVTGIVLLFYTVQYYTEFNKIEFTDPFIIAGHILSIVQILSSALLGQKKTKSRKPWTSQHLIGTTKSQQLTTA